MVIWDYCTTQKSAHAHRFRSVLAVDLSADFKFHIYPGITSHDILQEVNTCQQKRLQNRHWPRSSRLHVHDERDRKRTGRLHL